MFNMMMRDTHVNRIARECIRKKQEKQGRNEYFWKNFPPQGIPFQGFVL